MPSPFMSSEEYDERAHELYNEGSYDEALGVLREGLALYPNSVELHVGVGYARLAREEFYLARRSFEEALVYDPNHEDALAGMGETLLHLGSASEAVKIFRRTLELGYRDDLELMLQIGRALLKWDRVEESREFFEVAIEEQPEAAEAYAGLGYAAHKSGNDAEAVTHLERALQLDADHTEARLYLANLRYDLGDFEYALHHFDLTEPDDHWSDLGVARLIELRRLFRGYQENDPRLRPWYRRLEELDVETDSLDDMLAEIEMRFSRGDEGPQEQLAEFGTLLSTLVEQETVTEHRIIDARGRQYAGSWEEIVRRMRDEDGVTHTVQEWMAHQARRVQTARGIEIPTHDAESFLRGSANAGLLRIVR
jgi:tetratricopeptide (TPR) repeat protein